MCTYCMMADHTFKYNPPWPPNQFPQYPAFPDPWRNVSPYFPNPAPHPTWDYDRLKDYRELLERIKTLEEKVGCPSEPNKADYLGLIDKRLAYLENKAADDGA